MANDYFKINIMRLKSVQNVDIIIAMFKCDAYMF